jgi:hypothetical protein
MPGFGGQKETKSPPGPNLHSGSVGSYLWPSSSLRSSASVNLLFVSISKCLYRQTARNYPNKNRTKTGIGQVFFGDQGFGMAGRIIWDDGLDAMWER